VRVDEMMMMISPFSLRACTTCEEYIIEIRESDDFIMCKWTLESYLPPSTPIEISSEIDEETWIFSEYILYLIDEISLPDSAALELDFFSKSESISVYRYISIIPFIFFREYICKNIFTRSYLCIRISIAELPEPLTDSRVKISIRLLSKSESISEHIFRILIEDSSPILVQSMEIIPGDKSRIFCLEILEIRANTRKILIDFVR